MRSVLILPFLGCLALAGCVAPVAPVAVQPLPPVVVPPVQPVTPSVDRAAAVSIVNREMAARLPGVNVTPYTGCVINNATQAEIADLAATAGAGGSASGAVAAIVKRPTTASCIAGLSRTT